MYDPTLCNTMSMVGDERAVVKSGYYRRCCLGWGVYDMSGNVVEWIDDGMVRGGDSYCTVERAGCGYVQRRAPNSTSFFVGVRCCGEVIFKENSEGSKK